MQGGMLALNASMGRANDETKDMVRSSRHGASQQQQEGFSQISLPNILKPKSKKYNIKY
jgi:hypothetical protein